MWSRASPGLFLMVEGDSKDKWAVERTEVPVVSKSPLGTKVAIQSQKLNWYSSYVLGPLEVGRVLAGWLHHLQNWRDPAYPAQALLGLFLGRLSSAGG